MKNLFLVLFLIVSATISAEWIGYTSVDDFTDEVTVTAITMAVRSTGTFGDPMLMVFTQDHMLHISVLFDSFFIQRGTTEVDMRFDSEPVTSWRVRAIEDMVSFLDPSALLDRLDQSETVAIRARTDRGTVSAIFQTAGIRSIFEELVDIK